VAQLPLPAASLIVGGLLACAVAAWLVTAGQAASMAGKSGIAMLTGSLFLLTWLLMMVAMMFPAVAPMVMAHAAVVRARGGSGISSIVFVASYLLVWTASGLIPLAAIQLLSSPAAGPALGWLPRLAGAALLGAGLYQLTPFKSVCLRACRSPLGFILSHDFGGGARAAARAGLSHGLFCLGCCWALMVVLATIGLMNLGWMAALAAIFFIEKNWRHGIAVSRVVGIALVLTGSAVLAVPALLGTLRGGGM
jgi:predicted metal-binding membrane protein